MDKMGPPITTPIEGRRTEIPPELLCAVDLVENREMHSGPLSETRGAVDAQVAMEQESNARVSAPAMVMPDSDD